jgi:peptide/nickel transport system substrate-binding protein
MKKGISIAMAIFFLLSVQAVFAAGTPSSSKNTSAASKPTQVAPAAKLQPQRGGTMRFVTDRLTTNFGHPKFIGTGTAPVLGCLESLANLDAQGNTIPHLATSWDTDPAKKTITFHLRKGVKFHDGTEFNAAAVKWNWEQYNAGNKLSSGQYLVSIEVIDNFTIRLNLKQYSALFPTAFSCLLPMYSPTAIQTKGEDWARSNVVGTGPYKFTEYRRDALLKFTRFDDYWGGKPYLDGVEFRIVADPMTASASIRAGEADAWFSASRLPPKEVVELQKQGYNVTSYPQTMMHLLPDTVHPDSPFAKKGVREAIEYAIDKVTMAKAMGYGLMDAGYQMAVPNSEGYVKNYKGRVYDPAKAKQLLAKAGYPNGFKTKIILPAGQIYRDLATAIQGYLAAVGIDAQLDVADAARFDSLVFKDTWKDSLLLNTFGSDPGVLFTDKFMKTFRPGGRFPSLARSPEFAGLVDNCFAATDTKTLFALTRLMVKYMADDAMMAPIVTLPYALVTQKYVHTSYNTVPTPGVWNMSTDWMGKK